MKIASVSVDFQKTGICFLDCAKAGSGFFGFQETENRSLHAVTSESVSVGFRKTGNWILDCAKTGDDSADFVAVSNYFHLFL